MAFKYLGVKIFTYRNLTQEVRNQVNKTTQISGCLQEIIWQNAYTYMSTESKIRIYKICMRPILTYTAETQAETSKTKQLLRSAEMRVLRNIKGVILRDRIRSDDIRAECNVIDVAR
jgi:hypothetical protein